MTSRRNRKMNPYLAGALSILGAIAAGTFLLAVPASQASGEWGGFADTLFTAFSAVCVTGLSVIDVGRELSPFGLGVLTVLVELGGLGYMTFGTMILLAIGQRLSMGDEFTVMSAYGSEEMHGVKGLLRWTVLSTVAVQAAGTVTLWSRLTPAPAFSAEALADAPAWGKAFFYTAMAWSNAGFGLEPDSIAFAAHDPVFYHACGILGTFGGLGFLVIYNLITFRGRKRGTKIRGRLSLHARLALTVSLSLIAAGALLFGLLEWNNSLSGFGMADKIGLSVFQSATARTIGLTVIQVEDMSPAAQMLNDILMFCGASPGSTGGGVKTTTIAILACTIFAMCRGRNETVVFKRTVNNEIVRESIVIFVLYVVAAFLGTGVLLAVEPAGEERFGRLLFEVMSAVSTTGLSAGDTTASLSGAGRVVIMACMLFGRLGALTMVFMIGRDTSPSRIHHPTEEVVVG